MEADRLVPVTFPLTTQPTAAHTAASGLALHWYTQDASVDPPPEYRNLVGMWGWLYACARGGGFAGTTRVKTCVRKTECNA